MGNGYQGEFLRTFFGTGNTPQSFGVGNGEFVKVSSFALWLDVKWGIGTGFRVRE